jgi:hypothetical protein
MTWGPFQSELGGKPIMEHLSKQVFPVVKEIQQLSLEIGDYKQGFINSFFRARLSELQEKYRKVNKKFLQAYHIYQTPDELFKDATINQKKDEQKIAVMISDYMNTKNIIMPHFQEGFVLLEMMDRNLTRCSQSADQRVSTFLSILAITISIVLALSK